MPPEQKEKLREEFIKEWRTSVEGGLLPRGYLSTHYQSDFDEMAKWWLSKLEDSLASYKQGLERDVASKIKNMYGFTETEEGRTMSAEKYGYNQACSDILAIINKK